MIRLTPLRTLTLETAPHAGRPAYVSAASGLVRLGARLHVVADDENHLAIFPAHGAAPGNLVRLVEGTLPLDDDRRKRRKPDFESLARLPAFGRYPHGALLALGSCSKPNRCRGVLMGIDSMGALEGGVRHVDFAPLRDALERRFGRLNIEGAVVLGEELVLLQRGNKGDRRNARVRLRLDHAMRSLAERGQVDLDALVDINEVELGSVGDVPLCFSDGAALPDGRMVFTAIAEDTADSYEDGACLGAAVGVIGPKGAIERLVPLEGCPKVEGIEAILDGEWIRLLAVTDADDVTIPAVLLEGRLPA